jgi:hypothetical protein
MAGGAAGAVEDGLAALGGGAQLAVLQCGLGTGFCPKVSEMWRSGEPTPFRTCKAGSDAHRKKPENKITGADNVLSVASVRNG